MEQDRTIIHGRITSDASGGLLGYELGRLYSDEPCQRDFRIVERDALPMRLTAMVYFMPRLGDQPLAPNAKNYANLGIGELLYHVDRMVRLWDVVIDPHGRLRVEDNKRLVSLERVVGVFWRECATVGGDADGRAGSSDPAAQD